MIVILLSIATQGIYAQEKEDDTSTNKDIKFEEYTNTEAGYKISYPSDIAIMEEDFSGIPTITGKKNGELEWEFKINTIKHTSLDSAEEAIDDNIKQHGNEITREKKPLTVGGQPAFMFSYIPNIITNDVLKQESALIKMYANNILYSFYISAFDESDPTNKFNQYADLFFTMLKSFKLLDQKSDN